MQALRGVGGWVDVVIGRVDRVGNGEDGDGDKCWVKRRLAFPHPGLGMSVGYAAVARLPTAIGRLWVRFFVTRHEYTLH